MATLFLSVHVRKKENSMQEPESGRDSQKVPAKTQVLAQRHLEFHIKNCIPLDHSLLNHHTYLFNNYIAILQFQINEIKIKQNFIEHKSINQSNNQLINQSTNQLINRIIRD